MASQGSNDKIAELLKEACPPVAASPEFKAQLRLQVNEQAAALGGATPKPLWQQPFVWIPAAAISAVAAVLIIFFVVFQSAPPTVTTGDATGIQTTAATLNGKLNSLGSADSATVSFEWGVTTDYGNETTPELRKVTGSFDAKLSGLSPNTTYHFRVKAVGSHGTVHGPDMQFTTGPTPPVAITSDAAKIETTSATLYGNLTSLGTAGSVRVSFEWGLTPSYGNETIPESMSATGDYRADLSRLAPGTTYYFRAKADGDGSPVYGEEKSFTTLTTPPSVTTNGATDVATTSATLNGDLTSLGTAGSVTVSFEWGTATGSYTHTTADQARTGTGAFSADLSGLSPGTTYYFRAKAEGDGDPVYGPENRFSTVTIPPSARTSSATEVHCTSATLNGILDSLGTAGGVEVSFEWGLSTAYDHETILEMKTTTGDYSASLTGLIPRTTYYFRAKAVGDGTSYGDDMMFTTGTTPPLQNTWYLSGDRSGSQRIMYLDNISMNEGKVTVLAGSPVVWRVDQLSENITYPADTWKVRLALSHLGGKHEVVVEIGTWKGGVFHGYGTYTFIAEGNSTTTVHDYEALVSARAFTIPSGGYVAVRIAVTNTYCSRIDVHVGEGSSYLASPSYPETTAPTVTTTPATGVEQTAATLNGYLESLGTTDDVLVYFEWGTTTAYGNEIEVGTQTTDGSFSFILVDLAPNTTYHFRARVAGDGTNYGIDMTFSTPP